MKACRGDEDAGQRHFCAAMRRVGTYVAELADLVVRLALGVKVSSSLTSSHVKTLSSSESSSDSLRCDQDERDSQ
jgi:hypothetical protein